MFRVRDSRLAGTFGPPLHATSRPRPGPPSDSTHHNTRTGSNTAKGMRPSLARPPLQEASHGCCCCCSCCPLNNQASAIVQVHASPPSTVCLCVCDDCPRWGSSQAAPPDSTAGASCHPTPAPLHTRQCVSSCAFPPRARSLQRPLAAGIAAPAGAKEPRAATAARSIDAGAGWLAGAGSRPPSADRGPQGIRCC